MRNRDPVAMLAWAAIMLGLLLICISLMMMAADVSGGDLVEEQFLPIVLDGQPFLAPSPGAHYSTPTPTKEPVIKPTGTRWIVVTRTPIPPTSTPVGP